MFKRPNVDSSRQMKKVAKSPLSSHKVKALPPTKHGENNEGAFSRALGHHHIRILYFVPFDTSSSCFLKFLPLFVPIGSIVALSQIHSYGLSTYFAEGAGVTTLWLYTVVTLAPSAKYVENPYEWI